MPFVVGLTSREIWLASYRSTTSRQAGEIIEIHSCSGDVRRTLRSAAADREHTQKFAEQF